MPPPVDDYSCPGPIPWSSNKQRLRSSFKQCHRVSVCFSRRRSQRVLGLGITNTGSNSIAFRWSGYLTATATLPPPNNPHRLIAKQQNILFYCRSKSSVSINNGHPIDIGSPASQPASSTANHPQFWVDWYFINVIVGPSLFSIHHHPHLIPPV